MDLSRRTIDHLVASDRLVLFERGLYGLPGVLRDARTLIHAAVLANTVPVVASHRSAAFLFELPGFGGRPLEVTSWLGRGTRRAGITVHETNHLPPTHRGVVDGIPVTSVARTLLDLSAVVRRERLERVLDTALARRRVTVPALQRVLVECTARGRRRTQHFRAVLAPRLGAYVPPESELEARFVELLRGHGLPSAERQVDLGDPDQWIGRVDFRFPGTNLVVEVDGAEHHRSLSDRRNDHRRQAALEAAGFRVLRFGWADVTERPVVVARTLRDVLRPAA
jgi:very-short-patch-repair endonuclease